MENRRSDWPATSAVAVEPVWCVWDRAIRSGHPLRGSGYVKEDVMHSFQVLHRFGVRAALLGMTALVAGLAAGLWAAPTTEAASHGTASWADITYDEATNTTTVKWCVMFDSPPPCDSGWIADVTPEIDDDNLPGNNAEVGPEGGPTMHVPVEGPEIQTWESMGTCFKTVCWTYSFPGRAPPGMKYTLTYTFTDWNGLPKTVVNDVTAD